MKQQITASQINSIQIDSINNLTKDNFDWEAYVSRYPDLQKAGINTLDKAWNHYVNNHYVNSGQREGRIASIILKPKQTTTGTTTKPSTTTTTKPSTTTTQMKQQTTASQINSIQIDSINNLTKDNFDWEAYVSRYPDLQKTGINTLDKAWNHYVNSGQREGRIASIILKPKQTTTGAPMNQPTTGAPMRPLITGTTTKPSTTGAPMNQPTAARMMQPTTGAPTTTKPPKIFEKQVVLSDLKDIQFELNGYSKRIDNIRGHVTDMDIESEKHRNEIQQRLRLDLIEPTKKMYQTLVKDYYGLRNHN